MSNLKAANVIGLRNGKILIIRRANHLKHCPGCWSLPGGSVEKGETFENTAIRELKEETNMDIVWLKPFKESQFKELYPAEVKYFYAEIKGRVRIDISESSSHRWIPLSFPLDTLDWAFCQDKIIREFVQFYKNN